LAKSRKRARRTGLANWMEQVLACHRTAVESPDVRAVHQLRKALRRCRTLASALREVDPTPEWRGMLKASRVLFKALGGLRDTHVLVIWLDRLAPDDDTAGRNLRYRLNQREVALTATARTALAEFNRKAWRASIGPLAKSARHHPPGDPLFEQLAMRRLVAAYAQHRRALKGGSRTAWHALRVDIKRLRYAIENFLPDQHARWGEELAVLQEALGDVHDLDVLWDELQAAHLLGDPADRAAWRARLDVVRDARLATYRGLMTGPAARWRTWREELLSAERVTAANRAALALWGSHHGSDPQRAAWLADRFEAALNVLDTQDATVRRIGVAAALLHGLAGTSRERTSRKRVTQQLAGLPLPIDWVESERNACAMVLGALRRRAVKCPDCPDEVLPAVELAVRLLQLLDALAPEGADLPRLSISKTGGLLTFRVDPAPRNLHAPGRRLAAQLRVPIAISPG
jgi:CHAD domain-containing protein